MLQWTCKWARYVDKTIIEGCQGLITVITCGVLPNRLTPLYFKNYYEEENYLMVGTVLLNI